MGAHAKHQTKKAPSFAASGPGHSHQGTTTKEKVVVELYQKKKKEYILHKNISPNPVQQRGS
jgi:hypothetical protein